jgi:ATP-binding cassette subfamily B protein
MADGSIGATAPEFTWTDIAGSRVVLHVAQGSAAATRVRDDLAEAEKVVKALEEWLEPDSDRRGGLVDVYLVDPPADSDPTGPSLPGEADPFASIGDDAVVLLAGPEGAAEPVAKPLAAVLIKRWFGDQAVSADILVAGIGGVAAARTETGSSVQAADEWVQEQIKKGPVSIFGMDSPDPFGGGEGGGPPGGMAGPPGMSGPPGMGGPPGDIDDLGPDEGGAPGGDPMSGAVPMGGAMPPGMEAPSGPLQPVPDQVATSFIGYLAERSEPHDFHELLSTFNSEKRDEAFQKVFKEPMASLEEAWLRKQGGGTSKQTLFSSLGFLFPLLKPHKLLYFETLAYMTLTALVNLALPLASGCLVDALSRADAPPGASPPAGGFCGWVVPSLTKGRIITIVVALLIANVTVMLLGMRNAYVQEKIVKRIGTNLRERMFLQLVRLPHRFYGRARIGDLAARLSQDVEQLEGSMAQIFGQGVFMAMTSLFAAVTAITKSPYVGILVLLIAPAIVFANRFLAPRIGNASFETQMLEGEAAAVAQENLSAHPVIKAFGLEERALDTYRARLMSVVRSSLRLTLAGQLFEGSINFTTTIAQLVVLGVGSILVISGTISEPGTMVALLLLLPQVFVPIGLLAEVGQTAQVAAGSIRRANEILEEPLEIEDKEGATELPPLEREIHLSDVVFGYEPERPILHGLNLKIGAGANVALVGPSGSGKSTVFNLLLRFYDPDGGRVLFDDHDLKDVTLKSLRGQIGYVFQETFVFNSTLRDNIAIGRPEASDAEIQAAASSAELDSFIQSLPAGMDTVLGERGSRMSGGQRQRLAIARAILRNPRILVLDEATSALDSGTEAEILETLKEVSKGRTTLSISHRLQIAAAADYVFVFDEGDLVEQGTHEELVRAGQLYQRLYDEQASSAVQGLPPRTGLEATRLQRVPLFAGASADALAAVAERLGVETYTEGDVVVRQGDAGDKLYVIGRGQADVFIDRSGTRHRVRRLADGDFFGEVALLGDQRRTATVTAASELELYTLAREDFTTLLERQEGLKESVDKVLAQRRAAYDAAAAAAGIS